MRVDSVGIYNDRGLVPNRNLPGIPENINKPRATGSDIQIKAGQKLSIPSETKAVNLLSSDESAQIRRLFGQFDLAAISRSGKATEVDTRPGRFVDITV